MINTPVLSSISYLKAEFEQQNLLFNAQPTMVQRYLETQARHLAEAIMNNDPQVRFQLPDRVLAKTPSAGDQAVMLVPPELREQKVGGWLQHAQGADLREEVRKQLSALEGSPDQAVSSATALLRFAIASQMVHNMLPSGRSVTYLPDGEEPIPTIPQPNPNDGGSAITSSGDAIAETPAGDDDQRGSLQVPFVEAARRFYLPQWVAFDEKGSLLVNSEADAQACLASMQRFINILHAASSLAPYMVGNEEYQRKRYGILGQLINQGRALALYQTKRIIQTIREQVKDGLLKRGLSISLPYYDDQDLRLAQLELEIIPAGRIEFKSVFVLRAVRLEHAKISQDTRLNASTRKHLLNELDLIERAFITKIE